LIDGIGAIYFGNLTEQVDIWSDWSTIDCKRSEIWFLKLKICQSFGFQVEICQKLVFKGQILVFVKVKICQKLAFKGQHLPNFWFEGQILVL